MKNATAEFGAANRYEILAKLATGGMAEIFLARGLSSTGVARHVVLKRILRDRASDRHFVRMFLDEARLAAQLQHANVAQVYDIGRLGDSYFFTMEYVHGETVRAVLSKTYTGKTPLPIGCALAIAAGAAAGLHHAHDRIGVDGRALGIVHRDISPSNLMVSYEGGVKVVDFGVAKASDRASETRSGTVKGKISYLSPEQCLGTEVDRRSDLFALGIVLWEMLVNDRLYRRNSDFENMAAIVHEAARPPSSRRPDVPPELDALALRLLAKDPADRFQNAADVIEAIEGIALRAGIALSPSSLSRLMRGLFGARREPWVEVEGPANAGVSVTSMPLPPELELAPEASVEQDLGGLPDFSARAAENDPSESLPPVAPVAPVEPAPVVAAKFLITKTTPMGMPHQRPSELRTEPVPRVADPSQSGSQPDAAPAVEAIAAVALEPSHSVTPVPPSVATGRPPRGMPRLIYILLPATLIGVLLGVWVSRGHRDAAQQTPQKIVMASTTIDAGVAAPVAPPIAPPVVSPVAPPVTSSVTASAAIASGSGSAAPLPDPPRPTPPPAVAPPTIPQLFAGNHLVDVADRCAVSHALPSDAIAPCAISACRLHRDADARRYLGMMPSSQRERVTALCPAYVSPATPPTAAKPNPCEADPMACAH